MVIHLFLNLKIVARSLFILAFALVFNAIVAVIFSESLLPLLLTAGIVFLTAGVFLLLPGKISAEENLTKKDAGFIVSLSWILFSVFGALPYIFSGSIPSFTDALFESVSGFTTTGASILTDIEVLPYSLLFWRSLTHWIGGIGIILLVIVILPTLQMGSYNLFTLESSVQEKIQPKIKAVGMRLLYIYLLLTFAEVAFLLAGGMNLFESLCHSFGTVATGGFSPKNTSIIGYSPYIQYVVMIFMLLAGVNFVIHYHILKRNFKKVKENEEFWFYLIVVFIIGMIVTFILYVKMDKGFEESFREAFFQVISIITCTGFASADYLLWPSIGWTIIFFIMFLGGSTGSTAGGIKMARHLVFLKNIKRFILQARSPHAIVHLKLNGNVVNDENNRNILSFISIYLLVFIVSSIVLVALGLDGQTASSSVATCMAGIGPGIGTVGPVSNFFHVPQAAKIVLSFLMLLGRLEILTLLMLFIPAYWRK